MSLTGINNLSYLTYSAIGLTGVILAFASLYDTGGEPSSSAEESSSKSIFNEPEVPIAPPPSPNESSLSNVFGNDESKPEEDSGLGSVFGNNEPNQEEASVFGNSESNKTTGQPPFGGKKKKRRTKKSKKAKKHRKTKHKHAK